MISKANKLTETKSSVNGTDDRRTPPKFWIAAYTRPRGEKKAALELRKSGIEIYMPVQKQLRFWSDRKKLIDVVIIPMIIFAHVSIEDIPTIKRHPLIIKILSLPGQNKPAHIPESQIEDLKLMLAQSETEVDFVQGNFTANDNVVVIDGSLKGLRGKVKEVSGETTTVWVTVDLLGGAVIKLKNHILKHYDKNE